MKDVDARRNSDFDLSRLQNPARCPRGGAATGLISPAKVLPLFGQRHGFVLEAHVGTLNRPVSAVTAIVAYQIRVSKLRITNAAGGASASPAQRGRSVGAARPDVPAADPPRAPH